MTMVCSAMVFVLAMTLRPQLLHGLRKMLLCPFLCG